MARTTALVVAGGAGERLGVGEPKAFVPLAGRPLLLHCLATLAASGVVDDLVLVVGREWAERADRLVTGAALGLPFAVCEGGATRQASVSNGLAACPRDSRVVVVHDAARPLVSGRLVRRTLAALEPPWDAVAPGVPVTDTVKLVDPTRGAVLRTVDRRGMVAVQTPQVFPRSTLERVHARIAVAADAATDDLALVERAGGRVHVVDGERRNLKITYAEDLALAEAILSGERAAGRA